MKMTTLADAPAYDSEQFVAAPLLDGSQSNVRIIRLSPGQTLPPHTHSTSDLMIYIVEGTGTLTVDGDTMDFDDGSLAYFHGDEELRLSNTGTTGLTALAFLAPPFPPQSTWLRPRCGPTTEPTERLRSVSRMHDRSVRASISSRHATKAV